MFLVGVYAILAVNEFMTRQIHAFAQTCHHKGIRDGDQSEVLGEKKILFQEDKRLMSKT